MNFEQRFRVPEKGFRLADRDPSDVGGLRKDEAKARRQADLGRLAELQERLYAERRRTALIVVQGVDASGKDGIVKHVIGAMNPQGLSVAPFKRPSLEELEHDFLWRVHAALPARGRVGVFNRSHYEEVLVARIHPELLAAEGIDPARGQDPTFWEQRLADILAWERHLARERTRVVKFFLHLSKEEQRKRFEARARRPDKQWKFSFEDLREHRYWDAYQRAYEAALRATSTAQTPWYVIPADHKWFLRTAVAAILLHHLSAMDPRFPQPTHEERAEMLADVAKLRDED
jgi:PPK2 family polyphosphate:nucleotide phosphotransferase